MKKKLLVVIAGPTCIGKSNLSIELAKKFNTEIISSDSRQFYKELNIGVAKLPNKKLNEVKHHLINNTSICNEYSIGNYQEDFSSISTKIFEKKNIIFLCGGSGLYIDSVTKGFHKIPKIKKGIREKINKNYKESGIDYLNKELKMIDPVSWKIIDRKNPRRLIRALEVSLSTNKPYSSFLNQKLTKKLFDTLYIFLNEKRELLYQNINKRVDKMISEGLQDEAEKLLPYKDKKPLQTIGYKEFFEFLENKQNLDTTISLIKQNTRRYAKRQITWFKSKKYTEIEQSSSQKIIEDLIKKKGG